MEIFELSHSDRADAAPRMPKSNGAITVDPEHLRRQPPRLPIVSELQVVRHYTQLSQKNFCIDTHFYPLGSCTMKYNPRAMHAMGQWPQFSKLHPLSPAHHCQGSLACLYELQTYLQSMTGLAHAALSPMAGAQGELTGVQMIKAYHRANGESHRNEMLVPDAAHGTNPASAVMCGYRVREVPTTPQGDIDLQALKQTISDKTAGLMLTNPSTLGVFERDIIQVAHMVHQAGGLLYYDGANLNAILGKVRPGDMGFDVVHLNTHKTFATPHGGGGPGSGPVVASERLAPFLPVPRITQFEDGQFGWLNENDCPQSIGRLSTFMGNIGILLRAYFYLRSLGEKGLHRVAEFAALNANYLAVELQKKGFDLAFPKRRASHEFIISLSRVTEQYGVKALDFAKRLLDFGCHAPTIYFPQLVDECLLIEPTETESKKELDHFIKSMETILKECQNCPEKVRTAPHTLGVKRVDEVMAAKALDLIWGSELLGKNP